MPESRRLPMSRSEIALTAIVLVLSLVGGSVGEESQRPNFVFILADDLGWTDLTCTGSDLHETPHLDAFAAQSLRFDQAYAQPTCSPSRAAILSGKNPARLGIVGHGGIRSMSGGGDFLVAEEYTLAEALGAAGYDTCHVGKWHVGTNEATRPEAQGFDRVIAANDFCCPGSFFYPFRNRSKSARMVEASAVPDLGSYGPDDHLTACLGEEAAAYLASRKEQSRPFFLNLWHYAVHTPIEALPAKVKHFKPRVQKDANHKNPRYAGLVSHLDDSVGRVLAALEENGLADNTVVVFYSDNGGEVRRGVTSNAPLRSGKTTLYEGGIRVPLLVRWPGVTRPGARCDALIAGHDFYPTLLGIADAAPGDGPRDGVSFEPYLRDPDQPLATRSLHWLRYGELVHYPTYKNDPVFGPCAAIRRGDWKLIEHYPTPHGRPRRFELFDLAADPNEQNNLAEAEPAKVAELRESLAAWQAEVGIARYEELAYPAFETVQ